MLITHGHFDHIHDAVPLAKKFSPKVVGIYEIGQLAFMIVAATTYPMGTTHVAIRDTKKLARTSRHPLMTSRHLLMTFLKRRRIKMTLVMIHKSLADKYRPNYRFGLLLVLLRK